MGRRTKIKSGDKFGWLTVIKEVEPNVTPCGTVQRKFLCKCDCGNDIIRSRRALISGDTPSCGCQIVSIADKTRKYPKGITKHYLYSTWIGMRQRCYNKNTTHYPLYGGRGITVCDEWLTDFLSFYSWALNNGASEELSLDRIDNNKGYSPDNCRWATDEEQQRNKRNNRIIEYNGVSKPLVEWSIELGINEATIRFRLDKYGFSVAQALGFEPYTKKQYDRSHLRKKVQQYSLNGEFIREWASVNEASENTGVSMKSIRMCATGYHKRGGEYIWKFTVPSKPNTKLSKAVLVYSQDGNLMAECNSSIEASALTGVGVDSIKGMCKGEIKKNSKGLIFKFRDE